MQLNRTHLTFDDILEYVLPSSIFQIYRGIKKAYTTSTFFANIFVINIFMLFFKESEKVNAAYRKIWRKQNQESKKIDEDTCNIQPFKVNVPESILEDMKSRIERSRLYNSLESASFNNRIDPTHFKQLISYWNTEFDWRNQEEELNKYPHFKTRIENIDVHFMHIKTNKQQNTKVKTIPLLLIHNWPGSFADFHNVIPILLSTSAKHGFALEIVCPSMPGCGFSEAPIREDFSAMSMSKILLTLMDRLGYEEFYVHGYGWGSITASLMARHFPCRVKGFHVNMCFSLPNIFDSVIKTLIVSICPFFIDKSEYNIIFPLKKKIQMLLEETGFLHLQCTKPATFGTVVTESPIALATYVLERFHLKKYSNFLQLQNGNSTTKPLDDLLTLVTILWTSSDFNTGARFFKETISDVLHRTHEKGIPLSVPCGIAFFKDEIFMLPKYMMENVVEDLVSYSIIPKGGHFAAIEEPRLLAKDIWKFIEIVENRSTIKPRAQGI